MYDQHQCLDDDDDTFHVYSNNFNLLALNSKQQLY